MEEVRRQFPITQRMLDTPRGPRRVVFLDHGASTHAPRPVLDAVTDLMENRYANVHRGNHRLSQETSTLFDDAMTTLARFVGADPEVQPAVLLNNTTQALDLAAHAMADAPGCTVTTAMEHHSNDLPHRRRGDVLHAQVDAQGRILLDSVEELLQKNDVKLLAVSGASNVTGYMPPLGVLARMAHDAGARILVDAAQLLAHAPIDVRAPDHPEHLDMLAAAGHKAYAPFGGSILLAPRDLLDGAPPYMPGGGTVKWVTEADAGYVDGPDRHQGGTPNIVGAVAFAAAVRFLASVGMQQVRAHERQVLDHVLPRFEAMEELGVHLLGPTDAASKAAVFSFVLPGRGHADVAATLDREHAIATRNGCFCAHPMMARLLDLEGGAWIEAIERGETVELPGATRATFGIYNTLEEADLLCDAVEQIAARPGLAAAGSSAAPSRPPNDTGTSMRLA